MNTNYHAHALGLGVKGRMPQEPADEFGRPVIRHVQPNQAVTRVRPIRATEITIEAEKSGLRQPVQCRNQVLIVCTPGGQVQTNDAEVYPPPTQQEPLRGGQVFVQHQH